MLGESFRARLVARRPLSLRVSELTVELAAGVDFHWLGGQHVLVGSASSIERFAFSIASADDGRNPPRFVLAVGDASSAESLLSVALGGELVVLGPFGAFTWRPAPRALLVGVGTGVAPLKALVEQALAQGFEGPVTLLSGQRAESDVLWQAELAAMAERHPQFRFEPTLTLPSPAWDGRRGRVQEHLAELVDVPSRDLAIYVCGKTPMVEACRGRLHALGIAAERVASESY